MEQTNFAEKLPLTHTALKLNIHLVNIAVPTNIQNLLRQRFEAVRDAIVRRFKNSNTRKDLVYINNREMRPADAVLRMNPKPDVALIGWPLPIIKDDNQTNQSILRSRALETNSFAKCKKSFEFHLLNESITVLVGDIKTILAQSIRYGFDLKIVIPSKSDSSKKSITDFDNLIEKIESVDAFGENEIETEEIFINDEHDLQHFFQTYSLDRIFKIYILGMRFDNIIDITDSRQEYLVDKDIFHKTFLRIWNVEDRYRDNIFTSELRETNFLSRFNSILLVLPHPILGLVKNFLSLENQKKLTCFESFEQVLENIDSLQSADFQGVICLEEIKHQLQSLPFCASAMIYWIDNLIPAKMLDKLLKVKINFSDEDSFEHVNRTIKTAILQIPSQYPANLAQHIPPELGKYLQASYNVVESYTFAIIKGKHNKNLPALMDGVLQNFEQLERIFAKKRADLLSVIDRHKRPINDVVEGIKNALNQIKTLNAEVDRLAKINDNSDLKHSDKTKLIAKNKQQLHVLAKKQYGLASILGDFIRQNLRSNIRNFMNSEPAKISSNFTEIKRNIFNFTNAEWQVLYNKKFYFLTTFQNVNRLFNTLLKAESIPEEQFIKVILLKSGVQSINLTNADWIFYDQSVSNELVSKINCLGKARFLHPRFNEVLSSSEFTKTSILKELNKLEDEFGLQEMEKAQVEEKIYKNNTEITRLRKAVSKVSRKYQAQLKKYREVNEQLKNFQHFQMSTFERLRAMNDSIDKLQWVAQKNDNLEVADEQQKIAKNLVNLGNVFSSFYHSLVSIKFIAQTLENFTKVSRNYRTKVAFHEIQKNKLQFKIASPVRNVLVLLDNSSYAQNLVDNILPMIVLHFRLQHDTIKTQPIENYRSFLDRDYKYYLIVANNQKDTELNDLREIVQNIVERISDPVLFIFYSYPSYLIQERDLQKHHVFYENLHYIRSHAKLVDSGLVHATNKLQISSAYLYCNFLN